MIGRIAFWLLLPALVGLSIAIGIVLDASGNAPRNGMFAGLAMLAIGVVLFVLLASLTFQALLLARRSESLSSRALPTRIAVPQFALYAIVAVWVALLVTVPLGPLSWLFVVAVMSLSVALLVRIQAWRPARSERLAAVRAPIGVRLALGAYSVVATAVLVYVAAAMLNPQLDPDGLRPGIALLAGGLPTSVVVLPLTLMIALAGSSVVPIALTLLTIVANVVVAQLLLWSPGLRVRLVNWFFRLGRV